MLRFPQAILAIPLVIMMTAAGGFSDAPNRQAFMLAAALTGDVLPDKKTVEEISKDLEAIYAVVPAVKKLSPRFQWVPGEILLGFAKGGRAQFVNEKFPALVAANKKYGPVTIKPFKRLEAAQLVFEKPYHAPKLAALYAKLQGVQYAEPNFVVGDGDRMALKKGVPGERLYTFSKGWGDCPSGCIQRHFWEVRVQGGTATLLKEHGDALP